MRCLLFASILEVSASEAKYSNEENDTKKEELEEGRIRGRPVK